MRALLWRASASLVNVRVVQLQCANGNVRVKWNVRALLWRASASLVNVRVVRFLQHRNVRVLV